MKLKIGETIKALRHDRELIRKNWQNSWAFPISRCLAGRPAGCYPDMELLPLIAGIFGVTVDQRNNTSPADAAGLVYYRLHQTVCQQNGVKV